jgi:hypothetical protein
MVFGQHSGLTAQVKYSRFLKMMEIVFSLHGHQKYLSQHSLQLVGASQHSLHFLFSMLFLNMSMHLSRDVYCTQAPR